MACCVKTNIRPVRWIGCNIVEILPRDFTLVRGIRVKANERAEKSQSDSCCCYLCCEVARDLGDACSRIYNLGPCNGDSHCMPCDPGCGCRCCERVTTNTRVRRKRGLRIGKRRSRVCHTRCIRPTRPPIPTPFPRFRTGKRNTRTLNCIRGRSEQFSELLARAGQGMNNPSSMNYRKWKKRYLVLRKSFRSSNAWAMAVFFPPFPALVRRVLGHEFPNSIGSSMRLRLHAQDVEIAFGSVPEKKQVPHRYTVTCAFCKWAGTSEFRSSRCVCGRVIVGERLGRPRR